jgi:hypothetical protein
MDKNKNLEMVKVNDLHFNHVFLFNHLNITYMLL